MRTTVEKWLISLFVILVMVSMAWAGETTLHGAAAAGDLAAVKTALKADPSAAMARDKQGRTPLHLAALNGQTAVAELLLKAGADVNDHAAKDQERTPLHYAAWKGHTDTVRLLLKKGADILAAEVDGETPLHYAAASNLETLDLLVRKGAPLSRMSKIGTTPLFYALRSGKEENVRFFLDRGADPKIKVGNGLTLLHLAARSRLPVDLVIGLVKKGLPVTARTTDGYTPLHFTTFENRGDVAARLLKLGADPNAVTTDGITPLLLCARQGHKKLADLLLQAGARPAPVLPATGATPLTVAAANGYAAIVKRLLAAGADPAKADKQGMTALQHAFRRGNKSCAKALIAGGAAKEEVLKQKNRFGFSPLLGKPLESEQAIVWYLGHSGWAVRTRSHLLIFDYFSPYRDPDEPLLANGHINPEEIKGLDVTVLVTHGHADHYSPRIFTWRKTVPNIHYVLGFQPETAESYTYMPPRKTIRGNGMSVTTFRSNDQGVGFFVEVDGMRILHMGDHANSRVDLSGDFTPEIDFLKQAGKTAPHLFFTPVSGCAFRGRLDALRKGVKYVFQSLGPRTLFPMHGFNRETEYREFADKCSAEGLNTRYCCAGGRGDLFAWLNGKVKGVYDPGKSGAPSAKACDEQKKEACRKAKPAAKASI